MRWYGALQEGPAGVYTILLTDFADGFAGGRVADEPAHLAEILRLLDWLVADGDSITLVTDHHEYPFVPDDPPPLWRTLVQRYVPDHYDAVTFDGGDRLAYVAGPAAGSSHFDETVCVVLVQPGSLVAMHRYLTGEPTPPTASACVRAGTRAATDEALLRFLRSRGGAPSAQDVYDTMAHGPEFTSGIGTPDLAWSISMTPRTPQKPDVAEFHLQHAETVAAYRDLGGDTAVKFAVLKSCERYGLGLKVWGYGSTRPTRERLLLPLELPEVQEHVWRAWSGEA